MFVKIGGLLLEQFALSCDRGELLTEQPGLIVDYRLEMGNAFVIESFGRGERCVGVNPEIQENKCELYNKQRDDRRFDKFPKYILSQ